MKLRTLAVLLCCAGTAAFIAASCGSSTEGSPPGSSDTGSTPAGGDAGSAGDTGTTGGEDAAMIPADAASLPPDAGTVQAGDAGARTECAPPAPTYNPNFQANELCDAVARVLCDRSARCCLLSAGAYNTCVDGVKKACDQNDIQARIAAGVQKLDLAKAKTCLDAEAKLTNCDAPGFGNELGSLGTTECNNTLNQILTGAGANGAKCFGRFDCVNGRCTRPSGACGGTCAAFLGVGATCNSTDLACDPATLYCKIPSGGTTGVCTLYTANGAPCTSNTECASTDYCATKLTTPVCKTKIAAGAMCGYNETCVAGYTCGGKCVPFHSNKAGDQCRDGGSACSFDTFCKGANGTAGTFGTCTSANTVGQTCAKDSDCGGQPAQRIAYCDTKTGKCAAQGGFGAACTGKFQCLEPDICLGGKCVPPGLEGDSCGDDSQCQLYLRCVNKACTATQGNIGDACSENLQCTSHYCDTAGTKKCVAQASDGGVCTTRPAQCQSGDCENKVCRPKCSY